MSRFDDQLFDYLDAVKAANKISTLNLGGVSSSGGGTGGPPGGFTGYLPQTRVCYDYTEAAIHQVPESGISLIDNLNRIRYRLKALEDSYSTPGITVYDDDTNMGNTSVVHFDEGLEVTIEGGEARVRVTSYSGVPGVIPSGIYGEDLTDQIGGGNTNFLLDQSPLDDSISLYYNGIRQSNTQFSLAGSTVTTVFTPVTGDELAVDYETLASGMVGAISIHGQLLGLSADDHPQYLTTTRGDSRYYSQAYTDLLLAQKVGSDLFTAKGELITSSGVGALARLPAGNTGDILIADASTSVGLKWGTKTIQQQVIFAVDSNNLQGDDVGVFPLRMYIHDVGTDCVIDEIFCALNTAPASSAVQLAILKNGTNILTSPAYIELGVGVNEVTRASDFVSTDLTKNDYLQLQLVQGDTTASDLTVHIRFSREV
jgi:hypothetical protein